MSRYYSEEFKRKIVELKQAGKSTAELVGEYKISKSTVMTWEQQYAKSGKFTIKDNLSDEEIELRALRKENKQLKMEVDILKQAALILARKPEVFVKMLMHTVSAPCVNSSGLLAAVTIINQQKRW